MANNATNPLFDFVNSINYTKEYLLDEKYAEKDYKPFLVNRLLSKFPDTIHYANMMNKYHTIDSKLQYDFLLNTISKKKRYGEKSSKADAELEQSLSLVSEYYNISKTKAQEYLSILTDQQLEVLREKMSKGGRDYAGKRK